MQRQGSAAPSGRLGIEVIRGTGEREILNEFGRIVGTQYPARELSGTDVRHLGFPRKGLSAEVNAWRKANAPNLLRGLARVTAARKLKLATFYGSLYVTLIRGDGDVVEYGLASMRVVTTAGCNFLVDALQGSVEPEILKYHGVGTGTTAEASGDTALVTESTTILTVDSTRATGSLTEGASANIFRTVGTVSFDGSGAITEHGIFSQAATGGGTLLDRSVFSAVNVISGDSISFTYDFTIVAGS